MTQLTAMFSSSAPANLLVFIALGAGAGVYFFYRGFRLLQRRRLILNTPASKIRSASMGLVEVSGLATGPYVMTSPLKQVDCFYYRSVAWELKQQGRSTQWVKIGEESLHVPFYIDDGSGAILVDPRGADMDLHCDLHEEYGNSLMFSSSEMSSSISQFLGRHGADFDRKLKVEEFCIKPKNFLFVLGTLSQNPGLDAGLIPSGEEFASKRTMPAGASALPGTGLSRGVAAPSGATSQAANQPQVVKLSGEPGPQSSTAMTQQQRVAAALVKAGITNPAAWVAAGVGSESGVPVRTYSAHGEPVSMTRLYGVPDSVKQNPMPTETTVDLHPPVVLMKGSHEPTFLISWRSQRDLLASLGWKSALMIWGGPVLTLACVYVLLAYYKLL